MKSSYMAWLNLTANKLLLKHDGNLVKIAIQVCLSTVILFIKCQWLFYIVEVIVWGHGFPHILDSVLVIYLFTEMMLVVYTTCKIRKQITGEVILLA